MDNKEIIGNAMEEVLDEEFAEYINTLPIHAEHKFSKRHNRKMSKLIKRQRKPYFKLISTAGRRTACVVIAVLVFSVSALSVDAVRKEVFDFIVVRLPNRSGVVTVENDTGEVFPDTIEEEYYISALPEGFEETYNTQSERSRYVTYSKEEDYITFIQETKSDFRLEFYNYSDYVYLDGEMYLIIADDFGTTMYFWDNGRYILSVESNLDKDTILNLCKSIKVQQ